MHIYFQSKMDSSEIWQSWDAWIVYIFETEAFKGQIFGKEQTLSGNTDGYPAKFNIARSREKCK